MVGVILMGALGYYLLPISALPSVDFPTIQVTAQYPGASPDTVLAQKLSEVTGVGLVTIEGNQKPAVRVQVNPAALASLGISLEDIRSALLQNNVNAPKGSFDGPRQSYAIGANDQISSA